MANPIQPEPNSFTRPLLEWYTCHGRTTLPWQENRDPYRIWVSEVMLQQTQVDTVIPYFLRFMERFPDLDSLAKASQDEVLQYWAGLGYYARGRNLHRAAMMIRDEFGGTFPDSLEAVMSLPGIGRSTAGAILAFSMNQRHPILDGNVKRVLTRYFAIQGYPGRKEVDSRLWSISDQLTPRDKVGEYTQAIMDLGATLCVRTRPECPRCPLLDGCAGARSGNPEAFPHKKPLAPRRKKQVQMLVVTNAEGNILMLRRPQRGIWGGLWVLPEMDGKNNNHAHWCREQLGLEVEPIGKLAPLSHGFTHFELEMHPVLCELRGTADRVMDAPDVLWYNRGTEREIAKPVAMDKIFNLLEE